MLDRLLIVILLAVIGVLVYQTLRRAQLRKASRFIMMMAGCDALLTDFQPGVPAIVYFTSPTCVPCKTVQGPAIQRLKAELGEQVQVYCVDASDDTETADRWGVFSVPTTFILDGQGQPRDVNHGVADATKLKHQLQAVNTSSSAYSIASS